MKEEQSKEEKGECTKKTMINNDMTFLLFLQSKAKEERKKERGRKEGLKLRRTETFFFCTAQLIGRYVKRGD